MAASSRKPAVISPLRKRLLNLRTVGKEVTFTDERGDFSIWLQRITDGQRTEAIRKSKGVIAPILALKKDLDHPDVQDYRDLIESWQLNSKEAQVDILISPKVKEAQESAEARIAFEDEWAKEDYLISLQEAWNEGLDKAYALDPEDPEASRVFKELKRYTEIVNSAVEHETKEYREDMMRKSDEEIEEKMLLLLIENEANVSQMDEFEHWVIFFAARDPEDHDTLLFESREDISALDTTDFNKLKEVYREITFEGLEGKD